jgi:cytochrome c peroxidase
LDQGYPSTKYFRNTPTLYNTAYSDYLYWDGRMDGDDMPTLIRDHITEAHFMSNDGRLMVERLKQVPAYVELFNEAFDGEPGFGGVLKAVSAYVQSLNSPATPYDLYLAGNATALSAEAQAGLLLFEGKAQCSSCHAGVLLSDGQFYNTGVATDPAMLADPERQLTFRRFFRILGVSNYRNLHEDVGLYALTMAEVDWGKFRTPGLREVDRTAPYMHNGSLANLTDVVRFYNAGGGPAQTANLGPLDLTGAEVDQLVAFLESLSSSPVPVEIPTLPDYQLLTLGSRASPQVHYQQSPAPIARGEPAALAPLPPVSAPPDNPITPEKVELGRMLYFDPRMSADGLVSCNSCHPASTGFGAPAGISFARPGTSHWRHAQTILNVAYYTKLNWDGDKKSIEEQNSGAWGGAVAGNLDTALAEERLAQIPEYVERFRSVFGTEYPHWDDALKAVATYQRTIVSGETPFDAYLQGQEGAISEAAKRGYELFRGKANCIACHSGPLVSDDSFYATGLPLSPDFLNSPLKQITFRYEQWAKGVPEELYRTANQDYGLYYVTKRDEDKGKFRTPSLRDACYTAPYMHNGTIGSLEEVVAFFNAGGGDTLNKSELLRPLNLGASEQSDLVAFLRSLCGDPVTDRAPELPPYGGFPIPIGGE